MNLARWSAAFAVIALLATVSAGCGPRRVQYGRPGTVVVNPRGVVVSSAQPQRGAGWAWQEVRPPTTGLACRMPVQPRFQQRVGRERDGVFYRRVDARAEVPFGNFAVLVTEWEGGIVGDALEAAASLADEIFEREGLGQRRSTRLDVPGFYGREDTGVAQNGAFVALRQFVGRSRIYVAVSIVRSDRGGLGMAEQFMGSIRLDGADAILPMGRGGAPLPLFLPETDFAVRMPPVTSRRTEDVTIGEDTVVSHVFFADAGQTRYRVRVFDLSHALESDFPTRLAEHLQLGVAGAAVSTSGFPGRVYQRTVETVTIESRLFVTGSRIYIIEVAAPSGRADDDATRTFFDSFRIL
jgi:hypothetical protein